MFIKDLVLQCIIGTRPLERKKKQKIIINIALECSLSRAGKSDSIGDTVNYDDLQRTIRGLASRSRFFLIERLADEIASICLRNKRVTGVIVSVDKPDAIPGAKSAAVEINR